MGILSFFGGGKNILTANEKELITKLDFNVELMTLLKKETNSGLSQLPAIDQETADVLDGFHEGIGVSIEEEKGKALLKEYKERFRNLGYLIFLFSKEDDLHIGVLKGTDDLDILRYRRTDAINHDYENEDLVERIAQWDNRFGVKVIGCGRDWLELEFKNMPPDLTAFSEEVYEFCPDSVEQGVSEVKNLIPLIEEMHGIWLWWD